MKASIHERVLSSGESSFRVRWRESGKQRILTFVDLPSAEVFRRNVEKFGSDRALEIVGITDATTGETTLVQAARYHIDHLTGVEGGTVEKYESYLRNDLGDLGDLPLSVVGDTVIVAWIIYLQSERGNSGKTIANKHGFLYAVLDRAKREGRIAENPCENTRLPRKDADLEPAFLSRGEVDALRDAMPAQWRPLTTWLVATGMRFSEATALQRLHIDPDAGTARVARAWKWTGTGTARIGPPKSRAGRRTINLPPQALAAVGDMGDLSPSDLLFRNARGERVTYSRYYDGAWLPATKRTGIAASPHDLRHTCASWMIAAGVPLPVIQAHLGHESITTTVGVYGHLDRTSHAQAAAAITAALG